MAKLRKFAAYRRVERPYTRKSKYKKKSFVKAPPNMRIVTFDMGNLQKTFEYSMHLCAKTHLQIRHNALESARQTSNRFLEKALGKGGYSMKVRVYPHHVLRENPLAAGAGADRMSTGMQLAFGKAIGLAAQVKEGQPIFTVCVDKANIAPGRIALERASKKLPCTCRVVIEGNL